MPDPAASPLQVRSALLADYAKVEKSGLLSIVGGGVDAFHPLTIPARMNLAIVLQLTKPPAEEIHGNVTVEVRRPSGDSALTINGEFAATEGRLVNTTFSVSLLIDTLGDWVVSVSFGAGAPYVELPFEVALSRSSE